MEKDKKINLENKVIKHGEGFYEIVTYQNKKFRDIWRGNENKLTEIFKSKKTNNLV